MQQLQNEPDDAVRRPFAVPAAPARQMSRVVGTVWQNRTETHGRIVGWR
jgi:hypothetical protein